MGEAVVHIVDMNVLCRAIIRAQSHHHGMRPTRIVACQTQVNKWANDIQKLQRPMDWIAVDIPQCIYVLGVPVEPGRDDQQVEIIWSVPMTEFI